MLLHLFICTTSNACGCCACVHAPCSDRDVEPAHRYVPLARSGPGCGRHRAAQRPPLPGRRRHGAPGRVPSRRVRGGGAVVGWSSGLGESGCSVGLVWTTSGHNTHRRGVLASPAYAQSGQRVWLCSAVLRAVRGLGLDCPVVAQLAPPPPSQRCKRHAPAAAPPHRQVPPDDAIAPSC